MSRVITALKAKNEVMHNRASTNSPLIEEFFSVVESAIYNWSLSTLMYTGGKHFSEAELQYIRDLGYSITWNSPCLWYEISWEK